ncbi:MAG TPA: glycosyltransferase family 39 protein [Longimicrobiales bacterium]|nr:glycosyltransferase family 39 protein [Longimicrobiales bacterium]
MPSDRPSQSDDVVADPLRVSDSQGFVVHRDIVILAIVALGFILRVYLASTTILLWDEEGDWIPLATSIHIGDGQTHLPIRGYYHGILPAYLIRLGSLFAGTGPLGYRIAGVIAGTATILVVARLAWEWRGLLAARFAALLIAFNEYHAGVSVLATEKVFNLLFSALALLAFVRFIRTQRPSGLYLTAAMCGLSVLAKETAFLLVVAMGLYMLVSNNRRWLLRRHTWLAAALFALIVLPDVGAAVLDRTQRNVTYGDHLGRMGGIGFTPYYLSFYLRQIAPQVYELIGSRFLDFTEEYASMSILNGVLLLGSSVVALGLLLRKSGRSDPHLGIHLITFWFILLFFMSIRPSWDTTLNPIVWFWVDQTMLPATVIASALCASVWQRARIPVALVLAIVAGYATLQTFSERLRLPAGPKMGLYPQSLPAASNQMIQMHAAFISCTVCEIEHVELTDIEVELPGGSWVSAIGTELVSDATPGTDDRDFRVAGGSPEQPRRYRVSYAVVEDGEPATLSQELRQLPPGRAPAVVRPWTRPDRSDG